MLCGRWHTVTLTFGFVVAEAKGRATDVTAARGMGIVHAAATNAQEAGLQGDSSIQVHTAAIEAVLLRNPGLNKCLTALPSPPVA